MQKGLVVFTASVLGLSAAAWSCDLGSSGLMPISDAGVADQSVTVDVIEEPPFEAGVDAGEDVKPPTPDPSSIAGIQLWLTAKNGVRMDDAGVRVAQWDDSSGVNDPSRNALVGVATGPTVMDAGGRPALVFGPNDGLITGVWSAPLAQPATVFVIGGKGPAPSATKNAYVFDSLNPLGQFAMWVSASNNTTIFAGGGALVAPGTSAPMMVIGVYDGASSFALRNRVGDAGAGDAGANGATGLTIGATAGLLPGFGFGGYIQEIAVWNRRLSAQELGTLGAYAVSQYAITLDP